MNTSNKENTVVLRYSRGFSSREDSNDTTTTILSRYAHDFYLSLYMETKTTKQLWSPKMSITILI